MCFTDYYFNLGYNTQLKKQASFSKKTILQAAVNRLKNITQAESPFFHEKLKKLMAAKHSEALGGKLNLVHGKHRDSVDYAKRKFVSDLQEALPNPKSLGFTPPPANKYLKHPKSYSLAAGYHHIPVPASHPNNGLSIR